MAEEYVIVPRGAKNMTREDIIFYLRLIFISSGCSCTLRLVHGDREGATWTKTVGLDGYLHSLIKV